MKNIWKILIVLILVSSVIAVVMLKKAENQTQQPKIIEDNTESVVISPIQEINQTQENANQQTAPLVTSVEVVEIKKLPRLVDLGADKCIPCKMMAPVLEELEKEYKGKLQVDFYDVWKNPAPAQEYGIRVIPTQIFIDPQGKELFRHEGYFSKEDILTKWKEFGFDLLKK